MDEYIKSTVSKRLQAFRELPFDVYCIPQQESYFADEKLRKQMEDDPIQYLCENSCLIAKNSKAEAVERFEKEGRKEK